MGRCTVALGSATLLLVLLTTGCVEYPPSTVASPVGAWTNSGPDGKVATLNVEGDGNLSFRGVPIGVLEPDPSADNPIDWANLIDVSGEWSQSASGIQITTERVGTAPSILSSLTIGGTVDSPCLVIVVNPDHDRGAIALLAHDPRPPASRRLKGRDGYRVRVGDYRILYEIQDNVLLVVVVTVGRRRQVYEQ